MGERERERGGIDEEEEGIRPGSGEGEMESLEKKSYTVMEKEIVV